MPPFRLDENSWSNASPALREMLPSKSPYSRSNPEKYWLKPATCVGSIVRLPTKGLRTAERAASRKVDPGRSVHVNPNFGLRRSRDTGLDPSEKLRRYQSAARPACKRTRSSTDVHWP